MLSTLALTALLWAGSIAPTPLAAARAEGPRPHLDATQERPPVVHAVLFYSPTCPHCHYVIQEHLLPLKAEYGEQLQVVALDVSTEWGQEVYQGTMAHLQVPRDQWGVPYMLVGDEIMTGSQEIPDLFPVRLEEGLAGDGIDLPAIPAIIDFLESQGALEVVEPGPRYMYRDPSAPEPVPADTDTATDTATATATDSAGAARVPAGGAEPGEPPTPTTEVEPEGPPAPTEGADPEAASTVREGTEPEASPTGVVASGPEAASAPAGPTPQMELEAAARTPTTWERFLRDPAGNGTAVAVLLLMLGALGWVVTQPERDRTPWPTWVIPVLALVGLGVAGYLSWVEVGGHTAVCGPVGDCNTVQQSAYARLFGLLPIGVLGVVAYLAVLGLWAARHLTDGAVARKATILLWIVTVAGTAFSIYLTFLEPFVIGATCMWCVTSAVVMTLLMLASDEARRLKS